MFKGPNGAGKGDIPRPMSISKKEKQEKVKKQGSKIALKGCKIIFLNISMH